MNVEDFDRGYRFRMVQAYPVISGVPDVYYADHEKIDEGFRYVLEARNLRRTHEMYLADRWRCSHSPRCADSACSDNPAIQQWVTR